jgi:hypothetical protein
MSTTVTETYLRVVHETHDAVYAALSTDTKKEAAAIAFSASLNSEEVKKRAYEDVKELAQTVRGIRAMFGNIDVTLVSFDNKKFKDKDGKELQLSPEWRERMNVSFILFLSAYPLNSFYCTAFRGDYARQLRECDKRCQCYERYVITSIYASPRLSVAEITAILGTDIVATPVTYEDFKTEVDNFIEVSASIQMDWI